MKNNWEGWKNRGGRLRYSRNGMKWKRSRMGENFEGCEEFKRRKGGETDGNQKTEQGGGKEGLNLKGKP